MGPLTILFLFLAIILALALAFYQYRDEKNKKRRWLLGSLRFLALFLGFLLLINPEFEKNTYTLSKSNLIVMTDNSSSIAHMNGIKSVQNIIERLSSNDELSNRFQLRTFSFDKSLRSGDSLSFDGQQSDIASSLSTVKESFLKDKNALVLLTDGNQTYGQEYEFMDLGNAFKVFPIVIGDTTVYQDLDVARVNANRYAFLENRFPVEVQLTYTGDIAVNSVLSVAFDGVRVHRENVSFSYQNRSKVIELTIKASEIGIKPITVSVEPISGEKNVINNSVSRMIEVIDERTQVGIVTSINHPDLGALKKAIENNEQREVFVMPPTAKDEAFGEIDVFILYRPDKEFAKVFELIEKRRLGSLVITGEQGNWNVLNEWVSGFNIESLGQSEEIVPAKNEAFGTFDISGFSMEGFPPLNGELTEPQFASQPEVIAYQRIRGVEMDFPLFFIMEDNLKRAYLLGENLWKWRVQSFRNTNGFEYFDEFIGKLIFYLSNTNKRERLRLDYEPSFNNASEALIRATFFDKAYEPVQDATLMLKVMKGNETLREAPMLVKGNYFESDLSDLSAGDYRFTVTESEEAITKSGRFEILEFDFEQYAVNANHGKLQRLASRNSGQVYYPGNVNDLVNTLVADDQFKPVQKSTKNVVSLIDFRILLLFMVLALATEWFIRKYNGLY